MKGKDRWGIFKKTTKILFKNYKKLIIVQILSDVFRSALPFVGIYFLRLLIDEITGQMNGNRMFNLALVLVLSSACVQLLFTILNAVGKYFDGRKWSDYEKIFIDTFNTMDYKDLESSEVIGAYSKINERNRYMGLGLISVLDIFSKTIKGLANIIGGFILSLSFFSSKALVSGSLEFVNNRWVSYLFISTLLGLILIYLLSQVRIGEIFYKNDDKGQMANRVFGYYGNKCLSPDKSMDIRMFNQQKIIVDRLNQDTTFTYGGVIHKLLQKNGVWFVSLGEVAEKLQLFLVYFMVIVKAYYGAYSIGFVTQYIASIKQVVAGIIEILMQFATYVKNEEACKDIIDFIENKSDMYEGTLTTEKRTDRKYEIEFKNVSFKYPGTDTWVLKNVNTKFDLGKRLAIVGKNGSGKTTFIKLLVRFYDPQEGQILLNGIDIKKYRHEDYIKIFAVVFQDFKLFAYPLGENIAGASNYDKDRVMSAIRDVGFEDRFLELKDGLDTYLYKNISDGGVYISGGEAQKIAIARAIYRDPPFLILDEPTASLDPIAEEEIYGKLSEIVRDRTAIFISHRLSSCKFADKIIVFDEGTIKEVGTHNILLKKEGIYRELWDAQAGYYV